MADAWDLAREGWQDAREGEPLFEDANPSYAAGWCVFHNCANSYTSEKRDDD